jgi:CRP/FNR family transcriptional regulator, cyclic AMP receptor protein
MDLPPRPEDRLEDIPAGSGDPRIKHLERVPLFSGCTTDELLRVGEIANIRGMPAGTVLTRIGEPGDSFSFVIDGQASIETLIGFADRLRPGDFFGEMSLLDGEPRSATITATTDVRLLVVDRSKFWRLMGELPDLDRRILFMLSRRVRRLEQVVTALLHRVKPP